MAVAEGGGILVSCWRQEGGHLVGRLADRLAEWFGESQVVIDVETIEMGTCSPTLRDVRDFCVPYKVSKAELERLMTIACVREYHRTSERKSPCPTLNIQ